MRDFRRMALVASAVGVAALYGGAIAYPVDRPERASTGWISLPDVTFVERRVDAEADVMFVASSVARLRAAYDGIDFELRAIRRGERRVPRAFLANLPKDFDRQMVIDQRKRTFVKTVLPLVLKANEEVLAERRRLVALEERVASGLELSADAQAWLDELAAKYDTANGDVATLLRRVDAVSPTVALAQAIEESGWGRSRFARLGNALFGQRAWGSGTGLVPRERDEDEIFEVRAFDTLLDSVRAYVLNLNRHPAYAEYRAMRAQMRAEETALDALRLAEGLVNYSERREEYVRAIADLIRINGLDQFETAELAPDPVPVGDTRIAAR